ncbi:claspin [Haematobia irritans]|uniref:claspin n=1 Tax=Haematobia irritans TaxID=7368 RepID=UPI003F4F54D6
MDEHNISMEELKVFEEEDIKDVSVEDILGAQSLLMSESEDESAGVSKKSPQKKLSPKIETKNLPSPIKGIPKEKLHSGRPKRIVDSDDETGQSEKTDDKETKSEKKSKISSLIDSDSEEDDVSKSNKVTLGRAVLHDSESENERNVDNFSEGSEPRPNTTNRKWKEEKKLKKNKSKGKIKQNKKRKSPHQDESEESDKSKTIESESEDGSESALNVTDGEVNFEEGTSDNHANRKGKNKVKIVRASAKKAMDEMQAIQSEQQRLHREANLSIPYHKPKKHTLQDFLNRRTVIKPSCQTSSPITEAVRSKNLKMTQEELEEYAKLMEERAKEATEFFKSESESESEKEEFKDNEGVLDKSIERENLENATEHNPPSGEQGNQPENKIEIEPHSGKNVHEHGETENHDGLQLTKEELAEILATEEQEQQVEDKNENPSSSKVLITEVIELPKLDMNTVKISPVKKPPTPQATPRPSLNIKQLLAMKNLTPSPSLSGDPNKLIDLETGNLVERKPTGIENLMKRLMSTVKGRKSKNNETCDILSTENGKIEITKVNISLKEENDPNKEPKPRAAYFELKKNLKEIIKKKRLQEIHKKQEDEIEHNKCLNEDDDDGDMDVDEYEPDSKPNDDKIVIDEEENAVDENEEEELSVEEDDGDEEEIEDNEEVAEDENDEREIDDNEESEEESNIEPADKSVKTRNRIIKAFDDSDEEGCNDDIDFLKTQPPTTQPVLFETQNSSKSGEDVENELIGLCSGTFDEVTQKTPQLNALMSQIPLTQNQGKPLDDEELLELCSGTFDEAEPKENVETQPTQPKCNKILSSDEEDSASDSDTRYKTKKLTKKLRKTAKLRFSDDEEDDGKIESDIQEIVDSEDEEDVGLPANEEPTTFVDYDSEENEIVVQMTKKDCLKQAANFFEKEAELSESEWGSADEDERNLDKYDIELGDEDEFDKEKIRSELEQIHARKMLDEDLREVRKIQDMLFEDEEKDGVGRQRQFRWKNAESGFSLDDGTRDENAENNNGDSGDELNEHQWRKIRYEREQFLKEQGIKPDSQEMSTTITNTTLLPVTNSTMTTKKLQIITAKKTTVSNEDAKKSSPFLISKGIAAMTKKSVRGSFLVRDKETLNKLAGLTKNSAAASSLGAENDTAGTVSIKSLKPKNFVFATLTEEEHENMKRKADDLLNSSNENGTNFMKKPKIEPRRDKCFIDQLL